MRTKSLFLAVTVCVIGLPYSADSVTARAADTAPGASLSGLSGLPAAG